MENIKDSLRRGPREALAILQSTLTAPSEVLANHLAVVWSCASCVAPHPRDLRDLRDLPRKGNLICRHAIAACGPSSLSLSFSEVILFVGLMTRDQGRLALSETLRP